MYVLVRLVLRPLERTCSDSVLPVAVSDNVGNRNILEDVVGEDHEVGLLKLHPQGHRRRKFNTNGVLVDLLDTAEGICFTGLDVCIPYNGLSLAIPTG